MIARRPCGAKVDREDTRDFAVGRLFSAATAGSLPEYVDYTAEFGLVRDQWPTQACTGFSKAKVALMVGRLHGLQVNEFSPSYTYFHGRWPDRREGSEEVIDDGAYPRTVSRQARRWGFVADTLWPFDPVRVNDEPPWERLIQAVRIRLGEFYRVLSLGEARVLEVRRALAEGHIPDCTMVVDEALATYAGAGLVGAPAGAFQGRHRMPIIGYGPGYFTLGNSWGSSYGRNGFLFVSDARIAHPSTTDIECATFLQT